MTDIGPIEGLEEFFGSDPTLEGEGVWVPVPGREGTRIKLRSGGGKAARTFALSLQRKYVPYYQTKKSPPVDELDKDQVELMAKVLVVDWEGFSGLPCTPANVRAVMTRYPAFREWCSRTADEREHYRQADQDAIEGNSLTPSERT